MNETIDNLAIDLTWAKIIFSDWWWQVSSERKDQYLSRKLRQRGYINEAQLIENVFG
jgi:hypothetical protein